MTGTPAVEDTGTLGSRPRLPYEPATKDSDLDLLETIRVLRAAAPALLAQGALHCRLVRIEWAHEKRRLLQMLLAALVGFAGLLCLMLYVGVLVIALSWNTPYRVAAVVGSIALYGLAIVVATHRWRAMTALGLESFAATRGELAADMALLRNKL